MSSYDPDHRARSADAGGGWIIGIIVVVLLALGLWWWAGAGSGPEAVGAHLTAPPTTNGSAPALTHPMPAPAAPRAPQ
jgi:hypothetical protein